MLLLAFQRSAVLSGPGSGGDSGLRLWKWPEGSAQLLSTPAEGATDTSPARMHGTGPASGAEPTAPSALAVPTGVPAAHSALHAAVGAAFSAGLPLLLIPVLFVERGQQQQLQQCQSPHGGGNEGIMGVASGGGGSFVAAASETVITAMSDVGSDLSGGGVSCCAVTLPCF